MVQEEELTPHHIKKKTQSKKNKPKPDRKLLAPNYSSATTGLVLFYAIQ